MRMLHEINTSCAAVRGGLRVTTVSARDLVLNMLSELTELKRRPQANCYELQWLVGSARARGHGSLQRPTVLMKQNISMASK